VAIKGPAAYGAHDRHFLRDLRHGILDETTGAFALTHNVPRASRRNGCAKTRTPISSRGHLIAFAECDDASMTDAIKEHEKNLTGYEPISPTTVEDASAGAPQVHIGLRRAGQLTGGSNQVWVLGILYVEASHLALSKTENVSDRLVFKPVRLPLERFAFEIADGLPDFCDDRAIRSSMKAHRLDVRTDHGPLARPVLAYCFAPMNVATIHTVGPGDIIGEHGQHAVNVPRVKAIVDAPKEFDITIHWFSP
jgi:hypothetical protein